ncbi:protein ACCELERATED CELL DEATH 6-like [Corylus avellana]|uniref:protein ACCELERATED CELL DEATH 6-like n=1 Tax=Corylus avellana TaxID=13451 RepID=UPI00286D1AF6|nr:protein ACCELERATED CELL DEATH 6-like [Corylus avellana]
MGRELEIEKDEEAVSLATFQQPKMPYQAVLKGNWLGMAKFYEKYPSHLFDYLTVDRDTAFHIAAYSEFTELLTRLLSLVPNDRVFETLSKKNIHGNTILHEVAATDKVESAKILIRKLHGIYGLDKVSGNNMAHLRELLECRNQLGETPLYRAVALGHFKMAKFLAAYVEDNIRDHFHRNDNMSILHIAVIGQHFETAAWLLRKDKALGPKKGAYDTTCLHLLAKMPSAFRSSCRMGKMETLLYKWLPSHYHYDDDNDDDDETDLTLSSQLMEDLENGQDDFLGESRLSSLAGDDVVGGVEEGKGGEGSEKGEQSSIKGGGEEERCERNREPYTPLLIAASKGIQEIFDEILEVHPQAIEHVSQDEENILHVAIRHRQREIFRRVKNMKIIMDRRLVSRIDKRGYTILHHVADMKDYDGGTRAGPALQLQEELKWLKRVQKIIPNQYVIHRNNDNKTADELFKLNHADLLKRAQRWTKETSQSCSAVSVLVATVVFAAAYTVPGGNDDSGQPHFLNSPFFLFFTVMDVVSLASSLTSVVTFLSILSSPFELEDFHRSLPSKLMIGFSLLFFSVTATMLSFTATILLIIRLEKRRWTSSLIYTAAFLPVAVFALMQFPLYIAFTRGVHSLLKKILKRVPILKLLPRFFKG